MNFNELDKNITKNLKEIGIPFLRYSLAIVFIWFGILKPFGLSPAQLLVENTVYWFDPSWFVPLLGWWEVLIGLCLLYKPLIRLGIGLLALQMIGTFLPVFILPGVVFGDSFYSLTLEGQYIVKNLVIIGAAMVIGSHVRD
tara:strand:+ start:52967 stop:53389 length:423 start_codon:yes stop_codon:yes gene_type:complete